MEKKNQKTLQMLIELEKSHQKQLDRSNAKLEAIKKALPDPRSLGYWGSGQKAFVEKVRTIIDAP
jgi:uncharacterized protein YPO0396